MFDVKQFGPNLAKNLTSLQQDFAFADVISVRLEARALASV